MISTLLLTAAIAAHPLGNFSVNELVELTLRPDRVDAVAVVDLAELPTLQMAPSCDEFATALTLRVNGATTPWTIQSRHSEQPDGAAGLKTTRLTCNLTAAAKLDSSATIDIDNTYLSDRVGWHEITATGDGVTLQTNLPSRSATDQLRNYPTDPLSTPMQVRRTTLRTTPGVDAQRSAAAITEDESLIKRAETFLTNAIGDPTPFVGLLAVLLSIMLGAAHAALPGHGKTVIAVYMAGRKGRRRDALYVGATVTLTHTAGVLILGLGLTAVASLAAESVLAWLGVAAGTVMLAVGVGMLFTALRQRRAAALAAAHAEASAARWIEIARWHDLDHGIGIVRTGKTNGSASIGAAHVDNTVNAVHAPANGLAHADGRVRADEPIHTDRVLNMDSRVLAARCVTMDSGIHSDSGADVDRRVNLDSADYMHSNDHGHAHDPEDDPGDGSAEPYLHDHGHGHHHHGHYHHHGHGHGHEHGHRHGFWRGHRHSHGNGHSHDYHYDYDHNDDAGHVHELSPEHVHTNGHSHGRVSDVSHRSGHDDERGHVLGSGQAHAYANRDSHGGAGDDERGQVHGSSQGHARANGHSHGHGSDDGYGSGHDDDRGHVHGHGDGHEHTSGRGHTQRHSHGFWRDLGHSHGHDHDHGNGHRRHKPARGRASLTALGIAGGLVPSPTALVVLLGAVALGRTWFGIMLIVAYGLGMAGTLTAAGLLLLRLRDRWSWLNKLSIPPVATGSLIIALGLGLAARAALTF